MATQKEDKKLGFNIMQVKSIAKCSKTAFNLH